ncbi:alpha/beta hydrolase [Kribbella lupini]|uniref:Alpha/beta hydrolase n=1 Tax=Kribbella lupini TaxID=291602 RepID=A0ABP4LLX4_9ACTN
MHTISAKTVTLASGLSVDFAETGDPGGIPVVFVHGYVESWRYFELVLEHLPPALHGYALTLRGHGGADGPGGYAPGDFAADVLGFLDAVGLERAAIVGASSGGLVAQLVASSQPHRVSALVLLSAPVALADKPGVIARWEEIAKLEDPVDPAFVEEFVLATSPASVPDELVRVLVGESQKIPARVWKETLRGLIDADLPVALERITAPTLLIWGDQDAFVAGDQAILLRDIPDARQVVYEGCGHGPHLAEPERVVRDLVHFLAG